MTATHVKKLPHPKHFARKLLNNILAGFVMLFVSLLIGVLGYHHFLALGWPRSLYNASMILTGMGPVDHPQTLSATIFTSAYALYSGVAFLSSVAVILSPVFHRFLHRFKLDVEE